jgi:hypothetical protein
MAWHPRTRGRRLHVCARGQKRLARAVSVAFEERVFASRAASMSWSAWSRAIRTSLFTVLLLKSGRKA